MLRIGIDLGGTNIAVGIVNEDGVILSRKSAPTLAKRKYNYIIDDIVKLCNDLCEETGIDIDDITSIGIAVPGGIDEDKGTIVFTPNIPFSGLSISKILSSKFGGKEVGVINDANQVSTSHATTIVNPDLVDGKVSPDGAPYVMRGAEFNTLFKQEFNDATKVVFSSGKTAPKDTKAIDITADNSGRILMWKENDTVHISTTSESIKPLANPDSSNMFSGLFSLQKIDLGTFDSRRTRDMANMFANSINLTSVNTEKLKLDHTTDISGMFMNLSNVEKLNIANWDTSNVRHMIGTFKGTGVTDLDVSKWKTNKVVDMTGTFAEMKSIQQLNLSSWDVSNVKQMNYMFANNDKLITLVNKGWQTTKVEQMDNMFLGNKSLINFDPSSLKTDSLLSMNGIFIGATSLDREHTSQWTEKTSLAITENNLVANARELLRKMTPEEMKSSLWN